MDNLIERLEAYRRGNNISKVEMARIIGAQSKQQYGNWVARGSLPKAFYGPALRVLKQEGTISRKQAAILEKIEALSTDDRQVVERMIDTLLASTQEDKE